MHARSALLTLALLGLAPPSVAARDASRASDPLAPLAVTDVTERVRAILRGVDWSEPKSRTEAGAELASLGASAAPSIAAVLAGARGATSADGEEPREMHERERALLHDVLRGWPAGKVAEMLVRSMPTDASLDQHWWLVRLLGEIGRADSLPWIVRVLGKVDRVHLQRPYVQEIVENAIAAIVTRDRSSHAALRAALETLDPAFVPCVARALGREGSTPSILFLLDLLGRDDSSQAIVLAAIGRADPRHEELLYEPCVSALRRHLASSDPELLRSAVHGVGRWRDDVALDHLVDLLARADVGLARVVRRALTDISGLALPDDAAAWRTWLAGEERWRGARMGKLLEALRSSDLAEATAALRELSEHRIYHRESAPHIVPLLESGDPALASAACAALERLACPAALEPLAEMLDDPREELRRAAHRALRRIAGVDLPAEARPWREWLDS